jgi:hypothetical protein
MKPTRLPVAPMRPLRPTFASESTPSVTRRGTGPLKRVRAVSADTKAAIAPGPQRLWPAHGAGFPAKPTDHHAGSIAVIQIDPDILVLEEAAAILRCTPDKLRRVPRDELPSYPGPGRRRLYLREDVLAYVRSLGRATPNAELLLNGAVAHVLGSRADRGRERQRRRTS